MKTSPVACTHTRAHMYAYRGEASRGGASSCVVVMACSTHTHTHTHACAQAYRQTDIRTYTHKYMANVITKWLPGLPLRSVIQDGLGAII